MSGSPSSDAQIPGERLRLRAHHLLCTLSYSGHGYSRAFTDRMDALVARLRAGEEPEVEVLRSPDYLCEVCPHRTESGCESDEKVLRYDRETLELLGLREGETVGYRELKARLRARLTPSALDRICAGCQWRSLCDCESMLRNAK